MAAPEGEIVIDPTVHAATVQDTWIEDATNHGARDRLLIGKSAGNPRKRTLIKFDLSGIPAGVELSDAKMRLQYYGAEPTTATWIDRPVAAHRVLVDWDELAATNDRRLIDVAANTVDAINVPWNAAYGQSGSDYSAIAEDNQYITPDYPRWISWDITNLTQQWLDGAVANYGVMLLATNEDIDGRDVRFRSADYATANTMDLQFRPKLEIRWTLATRTTYFLKDHLGTTRAAITDAGDVVGYDDYDPWGLILANRSMASQPNMPYKFTGKEWDDDFGLNLYHFDWRSYDPVVGRFLSTDPLARLTPHVSSFHYAENNPVNAIDTDGRFATKFHKRMTILALQQKGYNLAAAKMAAAGNAYVDRTSNFRNNNEHGMSNFRQNRQQAFRKNMSSVNRHLRMAVNAAKNKPGAALFLLGAAQHTQQDIFRHKYFTMAEHLLGFWNILLDQVPLDKESTVATKVSIALTATFESLIKEKYGKKADAILSSLKNFNNESNTDGDSTTGGKGYTGFRRWVAQDVWQDKDGNFQLRQ